MKLHDDAILLNGINSDTGLGMSDLNEKLAQNFVVVRKLGEGGMGAVYLAREKSTGEEVALKLIHKQLLTDPKMIQRFNQEAIAVRGLVHPNHVCLRDSDVPLQGSPYIVMDYIHGIDLATVIARHGPLSPAEALDVFIQVTDALAYAHGKGIIHRDVKPSNIIISLGADKLVKVVDFGIAKMLKTVKRTELTEESEIIGTPYYMSPEQCQGDPMDARSDVYSTGCVLYEVLCGRPPFAQRNPVKVILQHLHEQAKSFREANSTLRAPAGLEEVVLKCLEKRPEDRYQSARELCRDLIAVRAGRRPKARSRIRIRVKHAKTMAIVLLSLAVGAGATLLVTHSSVNTGAPSVPAPAPVPRGSDATVPDSSDINSAGSYFFGKANKSALAKRIFADKNKTVLRADEFNALSDADMPAIAEQHNLRLVNLYGTSISSKSLKYLANLPLKLLVLSNTNISDNEVDQVAKIKTLQSLCVDDTKVTGDFLAGINTLPHLDTLHIRGAQIRDRDLHLLSPLTTLRDLDVSFDKIGDVGAKELAALPVDTLDLREDDITDEGLKALARSKSLRCLSLAGCANITAAGVESLAQLPMVALNVHNTSISKSGNVEFLKAFHNLRLIEFGSQAGTLSEIEAKLRAANIDDTSPDLIVMTSAAPISISDLKARLDQHQQPIQPVR
jgi:serine/threonine protein kinase